MKLKFKNKYEILRENIKNNILKGKYADGILPPEEKLAEFYGLNRGTVNKVMSSLESEGLISRKPRVGSIIVDIKERKPALRLGGLIMLNVGHVYGNLHTLMTREIRKNHYFPVLLDVESGLDRQNIEKNLGNYIKSFLDSSPDFLAVDGMYDLPFEFFSKWLNKKTNLVIFNRYESDLKFSATYILSDYQKGAYIATKHLLETGCKNVIIIPSHFYENCRISTDMLRGVELAYAEKGKTLRKEEDVFPTKDRSYLELIIKRFKSKHRPDGIFAFSDSNARIIQNALGELNLCPGRDYKMVGYYNTPWAIEFDPKLTSISINEAAIAAEFGNLLSMRNFENRKIMIAPELIIRETT
ncbi:MAG: Transcriptional regulator, LacI family [Candidatus Uhrbacteria bacterium GW2011_GWF2_39_13]|uniref:Transcriptional regulator, LacI family n=1 Tax=Candidatus Uhrbacteria bacterium GW2011_GWF2_39_13 TaxID=1618995 RepID=A0A0G0PZQ1_9BACT|nr:MAG: Transcriptional regulator, LacI family [Candidatus Uhrbacteria bacterium GW2011_GWF2_39_13]